MLLRRKLVTYPYRSLRFSIVQFSYSYSSAVVLTVQSCYLLDMVSVLTMENHIDWCFACFLLFESLCLYWIMRSVYMVHAVPSTYFLHMYSSTFRSTSTLGFSTNISSPTSICCSLNFCVYCVAEVGFRAMLTRCWSNHTYWSHPWRWRWSSRMGRKAGALYINPKKFGAVAKPCMPEMVAFLNCLALNKQNDDKCIRQKDLLVQCTQTQVTIHIATCVLHP